MPQIREDVKNRLKTLGREQSDLARELDMDYNRMNRWINGTLSIRPEEETKILEHLKQWESTNA